MLNNCFFENLAVYEIIEKNIVGRGRPQMTIWCMRIACWVPEATNIHSDYVILITLSQQQRLHASACLVIKKLWIQRRELEPLEYI